MLESLHDKESMQRICCRNLVTPRLSAAARLNCSGSLAKFAAIRRASSLVSASIGENRAVAFGPLVVGQESPD
jgi:hypothetical protein